MPSGGSAPLLDLQAAQDPWRPAATRQSLVDELGAARVAVRLVADASHALFPEQPRAAVAAILDWARRLR